MGDIKGVQCICAFSMDRNLHELAPLSDRHTRTAHRCRERAYAMIGHKRCAVNLYRHACMHKWFIYSLAPDALSTFFVQWFAKKCGQRAMCRGAGQDLR